jgi:hypothetical protein
MTPTQTEAAEAVWNLAAVDPATKLFLLALITTGDLDEAAQRAGMAAGQARLTIGWLKDRSIIDSAGNVDPGALPQLVSDPVAS